jgi:hypothetical protein
LGQFFSFGRGWSHAGRLRIADVAVHRKYWQSEWSGGGPDDDDAREDGAPK